MIFLAILGLLCALVSCADGLLTINTAPTVLQQLYGVLLLLIGWVGVLILAVASVGRTLNETIRSEIERAQKDNAYRWETLFEVMRTNQTARQPGIPEPGPPPSEPAIRSLPPEPIRVAAIPATVTITGRSRVALVALVLMLSLAGVFLGSVFARERIIALWPSAARIYDQLGLYTGNPGPIAGGAGLEIDKVVSNRTGGGLTVEGDVANHGGAARLVPKLRIAVRDAGKNELAVKVVEPPKARLSPGESEHFTVEFTSAGDDAVGVAVTFAPN